MNKKDHLATILFNAYKLKTESLSNYDFNSDETVKTFINDRLIFHGRNGYMFHTVKHYKQVLYQTKWIDNSFIVDYIVHCNSFVKRGNKNV